MPTWPFTVQASQPTGPGTAQNPGSRPGRRSRGTGSQRNGYAPTVRVTVPNGRFSIRWRSASGARSNGKDRLWAAARDFRPRAAPRRRRTQRPVWPYQVPPWASWEGE